MPLCILFGYWKKKTREYLSFAALEVKKKTALGMAGGVLTGGSWWLSLGGRLSLRY